jgi:uncharacterized damage-inducible protein DinB
MLTPEDLHLLYEYNAWANRRVLDACAALDSEQITRDLRSSFPSVHDTLDHILGAERIWLSRWRGHSPTSMPAGASIQFGEIRAGLAAADREILDYVAGLKVADLERVLEYSNLSGKPMAEPLWQTLHQVANHGSYHRGQLTTMLRQLGAKPAGTDLIMFYRERAGSVTA